MSDAAEEAPTPVVAAPDVPTLGGALNERVRALAGGDLGSLPLILGLVVIAIIFQSQNHQFLSGGNLIDLVVQMAGVTTIAIGVVFVLLLGEIDLSCAYVSGICGVVLAKYLLPGGIGAQGWLHHHAFDRTKWFASVLNWGIDFIAWVAGFMPQGLDAIILALFVGTVIGLLQGLVITKLRIPSFVVTLAGLLIWSGFVLIVIGNGGTIVIQDSLVIDVANKFLSHTIDWVLGGVVVAAYALAQLLGYARRVRAGLTREHVAFPIARIVGLGAVVAVVTYVCNRAQSGQLGVPLVTFILVGLLVFWSYLATRTVFGRHVYAVGGNAEAARRSGIDVDRIRIMVFGISGLMAAAGGVILASRLVSVDTEAGGSTLLLDSIAAAVIGGTSLFGGRGHVRSAVLGALVIASVANGMGLLGLSAGKQNVVTGLILLAAVTIDSFSSRRLAATGR